MPRVHELPTHLQVEDVLLAGLTARQLLRLMIGASLAYGLWDQATSLPIPIRAVLAAVLAAAGLLLALFQPGGRPLDQWVLAALLFAFLPRRLTRSLSWVALAVLAAALALTGAMSVAAQDHTGQGKSTSHANHAGVTKAAVTKAPSLKTKGNASQPGGVFRVLAVVKAARGNGGRTLLPLLVHPATLAAEDIAAAAALEVPVRLPGSLGDRARRVDPGRLVPAG